MSSRCRPVYLGFATVDPGSVLVHPGGVPVTAGPAPVFAGIENDSNLGEPGCHRDEPGRYLGKPGFTVAKYSKLAPPRCLPVLKMIAIWERGEPGPHRGKPGITVYKYSKPVATVAFRFCSVPSRYARGAAPVTHGLRRLIPVYQGRVPVQSRFVKVSTRFYPVFDISPGLPRFFPVGHGSATAISRFFTVYPGISNRAEPGS